MEFSRPECWNKAAFPFSRGSSQPRDRTQVSCIAGKFFTSWAIREAHSTCWSWNSNTLATSCEELTHSKRPWCWEGLGAGGEGDDRGWDDWMASLTRWAWVGVNSGSWWWTGRPGLLQFMGLKRIGHDWETRLNWTELSVYISIPVSQFILPLGFLYLWLFWICK